MEHRNLTIHNLVERATMDVKQRRNAIPPGCRSNVDGKSIQVETNSSIAATSSKHHRSCYLRLAACARHFVAWILHQPCAIFSNTSPDETSRRCACPNFNRAPPRALATVAVQSQEERKQCQNPTAFAPNKIPNACLHSRTIPAKASNKCLGASWVSLDVVVLPRTFSRHTKSFQCVGACAGDARASYANHIRPLYASTPDAPPREKHRRRGRHTDGRIPDAVFSRASHRQRRLGGCPDKARGIENFCNDRHMAPLRSCRRPGRSGSSCRPPARLPSDKGERHRNGRNLQPRWHRSDPIPKI